MIKELFLQVSPQTSYMLYLLGIALLGAFAFVWAIWIDKRDQARIDQETE